MAPFFPPSLLSRVVEFLFAVAEVVGGLYEQQLGAISLPHNVESKVGGRVGRNKEGERDMKIHKRGRERGEIWEEGGFGKTGRRAD